MVKRAKEERERVRKWKGIGAILDLSADGARSRAERDAKLKEIIQTDVVGWPWAYRDELVRYRDGGGE